MSKIKVLYPASRKQIIETQLICLDSNDKQKFTFAVTQLREGKRQNDHKFSGTSTSYTWISDIGGRKGGRFVYLKNSKDIVIWGAGSDHDIEVEAARYFTRNSKEIDLLNEAMVNMTYLFPTEAEELLYKENSQIYAGNISDGFLLKYGLNDYQIKNVRESDKVTLWDLRIPDHIKFKISQLSKLDHGTTLYANDDAHLERFIRGDVSRLLIYLDSYQQDIIDSNFDKPLLLRGETGTGKTTILIYKAVYYAEENPDKDVILFTYNLALANLIREAVSELSGSKLPKLRIFGFYEWIKEALTIYEKKFELIEESGKKLYELIKTCYTPAEMSLFGFDKANKFNYFLKTEIEMVIQDYDITELNSYLSFQRVGQSRKLGVNQRKAVWRIYQELLAKLAETQMHTYKSLLQYFAGEQKSRCRDNCLSFDAIFLDEVQDMPPLVLKTITLLRKTADTLTWVAGDYKQSIYRSSFRWSDVQLPFYGANVKILRKNYWNSFQILDSAHKMLKYFVKDAERPEHCGRQGAPIKFLNYSGKEKFTKLKGFIDYLHQEEKIDLSDIAIFSPARIETIYNNLTDLGVKCGMIKHADKLDADAVKISTMHSAKGLEFRVVIIVDAQTTLLYPSDEHDLIKVQSRAKLLYVSMTMNMIRAYDLCCFLYNESREPGLILNKVVNPPTVTKVK